MTHIEIPSELPNILRNFTLSVLRSKPCNIIDHAVGYFTQLQQQQNRSNEKSTKTNNTVCTLASLPSTNSSIAQQARTSNHKIQSSSGDDSLIDTQKSMTTANIEEKNFFNDHTSPTSSKSDKVDDATENDDDADEKDNSVNELLDDEDMRRHYVRKNEFRRTSVAAERYNPEDDDDLDHEQVSIDKKTPDQRQRLKQTVCHNLLFRTLEAKQIDQIVDAMWEKNVEQGETIIHQGDDGDNFYVIDKGIYEIYVSKAAEFSNRIKVGEYDQTGAFGELALMYNQPRSATIIASTNGVLWVMGRHTFRKLVLKHAFRKRQMYEKFLRDLTILQSLTDYERSNVADALIPVEFSQDEIVIRQGDEGDRMFFIEDGFCDIYMNDKLHKRLSKGDYFGELALLKHEPRSATVKAASQKVRLASLEVQSFERLLGPCMDLMHRNTSKYLK